MNSYALKKMDRKINLNRALTLAAGTHFSLNNLDGHEYNIIVVQIESEQVSG